MSTQNWVRSSRCRPDGLCVELNREESGVVRVRDSKSGGEPVLAFQDRPWSEFLILVGRRG